MNKQFEKEEHFLCVLAQAYITHDPSDLEALLPENFGYDSMWVFESITSKQQYMAYITEKLAKQRERLIPVEFSVMRDKRDGKPLLMITNSTSPDGGHAVFAATSDQEGNIQRLDLTSANFYPLEQMPKDSVIKRTYKTLLETNSNCGISFITADNQPKNYKGIIIPGHSLQASWGLAHLDDIPDDFCVAYQYGGMNASVFTKDTKISVDFVFTNPQGLITKIHRNAQPLSTEIIRCTRVGWVVELKAGQCEQHDIQEGDSLQVSPIWNTPLPVKRDDVIYEDNDMRVIKIWECERRSIFHDNNDPTKLYMHTWKANTSFDLDGNILHTEPERYRHKGNASEDGIVPAFTNALGWVLVDKFGNETPLRLPKSLCYVGYANEDRFLINVKHIEKLAYHWDFEPGLYGYIDKNGIIAIKPQYICASAFQAGRAIVCRGHWYADPKWGRQDAVWSDEMLFGMIDTAGNEVVPCKYDEIRTINDVEDKYFAHFGGWETGKWGIIDRDGNWIVKPIFNGYGYDIKDGIVNIYEKDLVKFYDIKKQKYVFDKAYEDAEFDEDKGWFKIPEFDKSLGYDVLRIVNAQGKDKFPSKYSYISDEQNGRRLVWINGPDKSDVHNGRKYGVIDSDGNEIIPCTYDKIEMVYYEPSNIFAFEENGKWGISDFNKNVLLKPTYTQIRPYGKWNLAQVWSSNKKGMITPTGKVVIPIKYNDIIFEDGDRIMCKTDCKTDMFRIIFKK